MGSALSTNSERYRPKVGRTPGSLQSRCRNSTLIALISASRSAGVWPMAPEDSIFSRLFGHVVSGALEQLGCYFTAHLIRGYQRRFCSPTLATVSATVACDKKQ